jgi:hypothetical protein
MQWFLVQYAYRQTYLDQKSHIGLSILCLYRVSEPDHGTTGKYRFSQKNRRTQARAHARIYLLC